MAGGYGVSVEPNSGVTIGFSSSDADQQVIGINLGIGTFSFDFGQDTTINPGCMFISPTGGQMSVDGTLLTDSSFFPLPGTDGTCGPEEIREIPPEPGKDEPDGTTDGSPTPTPTPTQTPRPTPEEESDDERPEATPTPTPTPEIPPVPSEIPDETVASPTLYPTPEPSESYETSESSELE
jgi:hypothetical protein